jgi:hypothetical protein
MRCALIIVGFVKFSAFAYSFPSRAAKWTVSQKPNFPCLTGSSHRNKPFGMLDLGDRNVL